MIRNMATQAAGVRGHNGAVGRLERRLFKLTDEIGRVEAEIAQARAERDVHWHLADDAARDAAFHGTPIDREDARETAADVDRFDRLVESLEQRLGRLETKRAELLARFDS